MDISVAIGIGVVCALACTIVSMIMIVPAGKRDQLPGFFQFLHDLFNFKWLILEGILKFFYILSTLSCVFMGFFMLFSVYQPIALFASSSAKSTAGYGILVMILGPVLVRIIYEACMLGILLVKNVIELNNKIKDQSGNASKDPFNTAKFNEYKYAGAAGYRSNRQQAQNTAQSDMYQQGTPNQSTPQYGVYQQGVQKQSAPQSDLYQQRAQSQSAPQQDVRRSFCSNCGTQLNASDRVCPNCGRKLVD